MTINEDNLQGIPHVLKKQLENNRREVVRAFASTPNVLNVVMDWRSETLYRATGEAKVILNLQKNADGSIMGFAKDNDGKFLGHARWTKATSVGSKVLASATAIAGHAALLEISYKLDRIEGKVDRVLQALADGIRAELRGAIDTVHDALSCEPSTRKAILTSTAPPLVQAIKKEIKALARGIEAAPMPPQKHTHGVFWDTSKEAQDALMAQEPSFLAILEGIRTVIHLYLALGEPLVAWQRARDLLIELSQAGLQQAWWNARGIRLLKVGDTPPEAFWSRAMTFVAEARLHADEAAKQVQDGLAGLQVLELSEPEMDLIFAEQSASDG